MVDDAGWKSVEQSQVDESVERQKAGGGATASVLSVVLENCTKVDFGSHADWGFQDNKSSLCPCNHVETIVAEGESSTKCLSDDRTTDVVAAWATICWAM